VTAPSSISLRNQRDDTAPHSDLKVDPPWPSRDTESAFCSGRVWVGHQRRWARHHPRSASPSSADTRRPARRVCFVPKGNLSVPDDA